MSRQYISFLTIAIFLMVSGTALSAEPLDAEKIPDLIQQRYESLKTFQADFTQELTNISSGETEERKGRIWFKQPSMVRWSTTEPEKELLVVGPDAAWNYIEEEELAIKYDVASVLNSKTVLRFLSGQANLKEDFIIETEWQGADIVRAKWGKGFTVLKLIPKEAEPSMVLAYIGVEPDTGVLRQVMIVDFYGNGNEVRLAEVERDVEIKSDMFTFTPPAGVHVEDNSEGF